MRNIIPYGRQFIDKFDINEVSKILKKDFITQGAVVERFEKKFANKVGSKYAIAVSSCSAGLHLSCLIYSKRKFKNIVTSPITFASTANAIFHSGKKPIFCDINSQDANISPAKLKLTLKNKNIGGVIPVHFAGNTCDMKTIKNICKKKNIFIIEDAAHALGSQYDCGSMVGSCKYSDITVFSMHPLKSITTGEGGMITTNSWSIYKKLKALRSHGIEKTNNSIRPWWYSMKYPGFHYRITDFQCALGISQLTKLRTFTKKREDIARRYIHLLKHTKNINLLINKIPKTKKSYHLFVLKIDFKKIKLTKTKLMNWLKKRGIGTQVHYIPVPKLKFYKTLGYNMKNLKNAQEFYNQAVSIPIFFQLKKNSQLKIIKEIKKIIKS